MGEQILGMIHVRHSPKIFFISILIFSFIYWFLGKEYFFANVTGHGSDPYGVKIADHGNTYFEYLYFSIVTQSLLGFGDIVPAKILTRGLVCFQIIISMYLLLANGSAIIGHLS